MQEKLEFDIVQAIDIRTVDVKQRDGNEMVKEFVFVSSKFTRISLVLHLIITLRERKNEEYE